MYTATWHVLQPKKKMMATMEVSVASLIPHKCCGYCLESDRVMLLSVSTAYAGHRNEKV